MSSRKSTSRKSTSHESDLDDTARASTLLEIARRAIEHGVSTGESLPLDAADYSASLREPRASFVTLHRNDGLRGCMGTLEVSRPLVADIAHNAYAAAFRDPRFSPLAETELRELEIHLSILSPLEPLPVSDEADLLRQLRPRIDGLVLRDATHRGTFLPSVWDSLPEPADFVRELKHKAGLPLDTWSADWEVLRYTAESIPREGE